LLTSRTRVADARTGRTHPRLDLTDAVRAAAPLPNDDRANARVLTTHGGRTSQTTWTATVEPGEPLHRGIPGGAPAAFRWTADPTGPARFSTAGTDYNTLTAVYRDGTTTPLGSAIRGDVTVNLNAGDTVLIAVDGEVVAPTIFAGTGRLMFTWNLSND